MEGGRGEEGWKIGFWNIAGLGNKDREFWQGLKNWEVIVLIETWVEEKGWRRWKERMPNGYKWGIQYAERRNKKGRAMGGMIMGMKEGLMEKGEEMVTKTEGLIAGRIKVTGESWRVGVYISGDMEKRLQRLREWLKVKEGRVKTVIGGDFNARTGNKGGGIQGSGEEEEGGERERKSKDRKINKEGRMLIEFRREGMGNI